MYKLSPTTNKILKFLKEEWFLVVTGIVVIIILSAIAIIISKIVFNSKTDNPEVAIEDTPILIESVKPEGELYVCTSIMEEYVRREKTEKHLGVIPEKHTLVQIVRQKCSYIIDLDKIKYEQTSSDTVYVHLPELEYVASTQDSPFISDDESYWIKEMPNTNALKSEAERKIRKSFETPENKKKANLYAEAAVGQLLKQLGFNAIFVSTLTDSRK